MPTIPRTLYKVPNPEDFVSELYTVFAEELPSEIGRERCWVVKEHHGYWDEMEADPKKKFKATVRTLGSTDPQSCVTIAEAWKQIEEQVLLRARSGFKYQFTLNPHGPPWRMRSEILSDGTIRDLDKQVP